MFRSGLRWIAFFLAAVVATAPGCFKPSSSGGVYGGGSGGATPGALDHFAVAISSPQVVGTAFTGTCTITAKDANNNTVTTFDASSDNVVVTASSGGTITGLGSGNNAVLNRTSDFTNGVATLSGALVYTGAGGTLTFSVTSSTSGRTGTSGSVVMNLRTLDHFAVSFSSPQVVGTAFTGTCTIAAKDASNNTVTTFDASADSVTVAASSGGSISGLGSGNNAVLNRASDFTNGVASVSGVLVYAGASGTMTFSATSSTTSRTGTSGTVTMNPGALDHFAVSIASP